MTDLILELLKATPEGLTAAQIGLNLDRPLSAVAHTAGALAESGVIWSLPLKSRHHENLLTLYFVPHPDELKRHRRRERRTA